MEDEFLVLLEDRLGIGTRRTDPELQHAAGRGARARNPAVALDLAGVANVDDDRIAVLRDSDRLSGTQGLDFGIGLVDQGLDAAVDGLGHLLSLFASFVFFRLFSSSSPSFRGPRKRTLVCSCTPENL